MIHFFEWILLFVLEIYFDLKQALAQFDLLSIQALKDA